MTIKLGSLSADITKEREGEWIEVGEWPGLNPEKPFEQVKLPGLAFHVRSTNFPAYVTARQVEIERLKTEYPDDKIPPAEAALVEGRLAVEHLLINWRGLDVEFSRTAAEEILTNEEHRAMRSMIFWCAGKVGRRKAEFVKVAAKN